MPSTAEPESEARSCIWMAHVAGADLSTQAITCSLSQRVHQQETGPDAQDVQGS